MPSRSIVTRENLSSDFAIQPGNASGPLVLNLNPAQFSRNPLTGLISVTVGGGGGSVTISPEDGTITINAAPGGFTISVAISEDAGNAVEARADGLFVPEQAPPDVSADPGNQIAARIDGLYAGASEFSNLPTSGTPSAVDLPTGSPNRMFLLGSSVTTLNVVNSGAYLVGAEYTVVKQSGAFVVSIPSGVTLNGTPGPATFDVGGLPDGVVLKNVGANLWVALGDCAPTGG